jgi:GTP-binding protein
MKHVDFETARFVGAFTSLESCPNLLFGHRPMHEIACVGRSNVGKSSLINDLTKVKKLARTSSTPGKTRELVFFVIDEKACLVDLPGYGYASASKDKKYAWNQTTDDYLTGRTSLSLILFLLDIRREPSEYDIAFIEWAKSRAQPILLVLTKADKISPSKRAAHVAGILKKLHAAALPSVLYSVSHQHPMGRIELIDLINRNLETPCL